MFAEKLKPPSGICRHSRFGLSCSFRSIHLSCSKVSAVGKDQQQSRQAPNNEQQLSALRQVLLQEYAQQLNSHSRPSTQSANRAVTKAKAATQQLLQAEPALASTSTPLTASAGLPGQLLHDALAQVTVVSPLPIPESAPTTTTASTLSNAEQQEQWISAIQIEAPTTSIDEIPADFSYALILPLDLPGDSPPSACPPESTPLQASTSTTVDTDTAASTSPAMPAASPQPDSAPPRTPHPPHTAYETPATSASTKPGSKYAWINPRRRELMKLDLKEGLIPLAKHYGLDLYKTKADVIQNLLQREYAAFLQEREVALLQLPSREQLVPLARSYGINPSGFKREVVAAVISQEFKRLTMGRREELAAWEPSELLAYVCSSGINLYGDKGLLVGRILVHEAKLRAEFCSHFPGKCKEI